MKETEGETEIKKLTDKMAWEESMNSIRNRAEEIVLKKINYIQTELLSVNFT